MVEVVVTDEFERWYTDLSLDEQIPIDRVVDLLAEKGVTLDFPYSSAIEGSRYALRELRIQVKGQPYRIFYIFDRKRQAVLLLGGNKQGQDRFYEEEIPRTERIWEQYLEEQRLKDERAKRER
jgi:hypothetical protein